MADVFISYHHDAEALVQKIADALKVTGISCWYMGQDSNKGEHQFEIPKAIKECSVFLLILDKNSNQSKDALSEVYLIYRRLYAHEQPKPQIIVFKTDDSSVISSPLAYYLHHLCAIDGNPPDEQHIQTLVEYISAVVKIPTSAQPHLITRYHNGNAEQLSTNPEKIPIPVGFENKTSIADVFISYHVSESSTPFVRSLVEKLEQTGISCWYAPRNVKTGEFVGSILEALEYCRIFLVILDEGSNGFGYVYNETVEAYNLYKEKGHPVLLPFRVGKLQLFRNLRFYLRPFHIIDGGNSFETAVTEELIAKITDALAQ